MKIRLTFLSLLPIAILVLNLGNPLAVQVAEPSVDPVPDPSALTLTLQHATLVVSNFEKSKKFYTEVLGLKELEADWLPDNQMFLALGDDQELHVGEGSGIEINPNNVNHFCIATDDLDGYLAHLTSKGVNYTSLGGGHMGFIYKRPDGVRQTFIQDPDGYWIEINDANKKEK